MSINRSDYQISIKTTADMAGLKAMSAGLQGEIEATKLLGKDTTELEERLSKVRHEMNQLELSSGGVAEGAKKGGEGLEVLGAHAHGAHAALHALNEAFPGLAQFSRFLTSGFTAAIGAVLIAFEYLKEKLEAFKTALEELDTGPGTRGEWAEKIRENVRDAAVDLDTFNEKLAETLTAQENLATSTDNLIAAQKRQAADAKQVADAQKELDLARLELKEKLGQITPEQAVRIRLELDDAAFREQLEAEKAGIEAEMNARRQEAKANQGREPQLRSARESADAKALDTKNAADKNTAKLEQDKKNKEDAEAEVKKNDERLQELEGKRFTTGPERLERDTRRKAAEDLQNQVGGYNRSISQEQAQETPLASAAAVAKQQADKARADYEDAAKTAHDIQQTIGKLKADLDAATAKNAALESIHRQTTDAKEATAKAEAAKKLQEDVQSGRATPQEIQQLADQQATSAAAHLQGPQAAIGANKAIGQAEVILGHLSRQQPSQRDSGEMQELHGLLEQIIGYLANHSQELNSQRSSMGRLAEKITGLERTTEHHESRMQYSPYPI